MPQSGMAHIISRIAATLALAVLLTLAGCGDLPRPFQDNPGATALRLAQPPPARLAVPVPGDALLPDAASAAYADAVAKALQSREVPAVAGPVHPGDWRLVLSADLRGQSVVPHFAVDDPAGKRKGTADGPAVSAAAWQAGGAATLTQSAAAASPAITALLASIEARRRQSDPTSLLNRPPRVLIKTVTGAPGTGNAELTSEMRRKLPPFGELLEEKPANADYTVAGVVRQTPVAGGQVRVEIQWIITDAKGHDLGHVVQLNQVPRGTLDGLWGDVAVVVAQEAAGAVHEVIVKNNGIASPAATPGAMPAAAPAKP
jgi:hypothetical protein